MTTKAKETADLLDTPMYGDRVICTEAFGGLFIVGQEYGVYTAHGGVIYVYPGGVVGIIPFVTRNYQQLTTTKLPYFHDHFQRV